MDRIFGRYMIFHVFLCSPVCIPILSPTRPAVNIMILTIRISGIYFVNHWSKGGLLRWQIEDAANSSTMIARFCSSLFFSCCCSLTTGTFTDTGAGKQNRLQYIITGKTTRKGWFHFGRVPGAGGTGAALKAENTHAGNTWMYI